MLLVIGCLSLFVEHKIIRTILIFLVTVVGIGIHCELLLSMGVWKLGQGCRLDRAYNDDDLVVVRGGIDFRSHRHLLVEHKGFIRYVTIHLNEDGHDKEKYRLNYTYRYKGGRLFSITSPEEKVEQLT